MILRLLSCSRKTRARLLSVKSISLQGSRASRSSSSLSTLLQQGSGSAALLQQSGAILARLPAKNLSAAQLVEALEQLAEKARGSSTEDLKALLETKPFRQLLAELVQHLPRDAGEQVQWESAWTSRVTASLRELRAQGVNQQLGLRLGHSLLQAELSALLDRTRDLGAESQSGVDDYALWVLGGELEELCESCEPGELSMERLVSMLHLLVHPAIRHRVAARSSPHVLRHVREGLHLCQPHDLAKLVQIYFDVPGIVAESLHALLALGRSGSRSEPTHTLRLTMSLPELTAIASALHGGTEALAQPERGQLAAATLQCLKAILDGGIQSSDIELCVTTAMGAIQGLEGAEEPERNGGFASLQAVLRQLGAIVQEEAARSSASPEQIAQLLMLGLRYTPNVDPERVGSETWMLNMSSQLASRATELPSGTLAEIIISLGAFDRSLPKDLMEAVAASAVAHAPVWAMSEFCDVVFALAQAGMLEAELLEAGDLEARLCGARPVSASSLARLVWAMSVSGCESNVAWSLVEEQLSEGAHSSGEIMALAEPEKALLMEGLSAQAALGESWPEGSTAASLLANSSWQQAWKTRAPKPSEHLSMVSDLLGESGIRCKLNVDSQDGLHVLPILLPEKNVILDLLASARHPVSHRAQGEVALRHQVWSALGYSVLAIPDSVWSRLRESGAAADTKQQQQEWLMKRLEGIAREDLLMKAGLQPEIVGELRNVVIGAPDGLNIDALRRLSQAPLTVQKAAVESFRSSLQTTSVKNPSGWMIGIVKKEEQAASQKQESAKPEAEKVKTTAATKKPSDGWEREVGRPLEEVKVNERLKGKVTNVFNGRVWVDTGLVKDVTFTAPEGSHQVGDVINNLKVIAVNSKNRWIEVRPMSRPADQKAKVNAARQEKSYSPPRWKEATSPRPQSGWGHKEGLTLAELQVGSEVSGHVTNIFHNRVWVNIGAEKDASFKVMNASDKFNVGDFVAKAKIQSLDLAKELVVLSAPRSDR
eukprot:TRINITY_DN24962_c0_g2_i1.p1 TRINITY_DN24962_c0_g2~~TRINITY_DN24962_c0_g2_i1.p1  ORF type:complete len:1007 (-),score=248.40 TRINITY_DN24962_c0_g2_i1:30-3026(-)